MNAINQTSFSKVYFSKFHHAHPFLNEDRSPVAYSTLAKTIIVAIAVFTCLVTLPFCLVGGFIVGYLAFSLTTAMIKKLATSSIGHSSEGLEMLKWPISKESVHESKDAEFKTTFSEQKYPSKSESKNSSVSALLTCPPEYQKHFDHFSCEWSNEVLNAPIEFNPDDPAPFYTIKEKASLFSIVHTVYKSYRNSSEVIGLTFATASQITSNYLQYLAIQYPHFQSFEIGQWNAHHLTMSFKERGSRELPKDLPTTPCLFGMPIQIADKKNENEVGHRTVFIVDLLNKSVEFFNSESLSTAHGADYFVKDQLQEIVAYLSEKYQTPFKYEFKTKDVQLQHNLNEGGFQCGIWACKLIEERIRQGKDFDPNELLDFDILPYRQQVFATNVMTRFYINTGASRFNAWRNQATIAQNPQRQARMLELAKSPLMTKLNYQWAFTGTKPQELEDIEVS